MFLIIHFLLLFFWSLLVFAWLWLLLRKLLWLHASQITWGLGTEQMASWFPRGLSGSFLFANIFNTLTSAKTPSPTSIQAPTVLIDSLSSCPTAFLWDIVLKVGTPLGIWPCQCSDSLSAGVSLGNIITQWLTKKTEIFMEEKLVWQKTRNMMKYLKNQLKTKIKEERKADKKARTQ